MAAEKRVETEKDLGGAWTGTGAEMAWQVVGLVEDTLVLLSHLQQG